MGKYINWAEVADRYPSIATLGGAKEAGTTHILYAEAELEGMLAGYFAIPFDTNNLTAKDCSIQLTYLRMGTMKLKDEMELRKRVMKKIEMLKTGEAVMVLADGTVVAQTGNVAYSNDAPYHHTYGVNPIEDAFVDPDKQQDEIDERR